MLLPPRSSHFLLELKRRLTSSNMNNYGVCYEQRGGTFHEDPEDVSEDGDGGAEHKDGEQEGADRIGHFVFRLQRKDDWSERASDVFCSLEIRQL